MLLSDCPIIGISPLENPDARLVVAVLRAGALGVLDLGRDPDLSAAALRSVAKHAPATFGVRVPEGVEVDPATLPEGAGVVVLTAGRSLEAWAPRTVLVQVTDLEQARAAEAAGANGLIIKGAEAAGRVGEESSFVLLQRIVDAVKLPVWVQGGVGLHTSAACFAGGAAGVVLDTQLALVRESSLPGTVKTALRGMDGSETTLVRGHRVFTRPDLPIAREPEPSLEGLLTRLGGRDLTTDVLPLGQDTCFASRLADRFRTAGGLVHAITQSVAAHLRQARAERPLAPGAPLAASLGIEHPIAQGPMTRVSDRAGFADAVSSGGGLPFLALALMRGPQVRALIEETIALLGDRTWGVGILGFVPPSLREEQLAVLQEFKPPVVLIAGGRPSQARPLEALGCKVFLHVPSPGLLDLFLKDGARRFIFEGRECGGHVGPRHSFALWETQIERLLQVDDPAELDIFFAGGIHDSRSGAMVAAMAAPLAARGARVGVLMGTAYLFTREAVETGAIKPGFQQAAVDCDRTVLLETAPGHSTRCVETQYVRAFREEKSRLEAVGFSQQEIWASLEQLNLGRLRIAAKGLRRDGGELVVVDEPEQASEGMFMIGQVASLRDATCTISELHADVTRGGARRLAELTLPVASAPVVPALDVAIIGIGCAFPGAPDLETFWGNIVTGHNAITEVPAERWNTEIYFDPDSRDGEKTPSKWGGFLPAIPFDPLAYGIPPRSLAAIEPVQLLSLEMARRALSDAGYFDRDFDRDGTAVIFGAEAGTDLAAGYGFRAMYPQLCGKLPEALDKALPSLTEDSFPGVLANVISGRIANRLDLRGANFTVDAACASSLAAVDLGVKELAAGTSNMVLCGGADLHNSINDYLMFSSVHALSRTGQCRTFDASADGIALGEGVAVVVLKRLTDAERDGDRVYAVIKGVGSSSDGKSLGLTAPRQEGQVRALERAYERAGVSPRDVGLVEAHGTGTVVGDRTELAALTEVYGAAGTEPGTVALGSVKSQIGHTKCAAGMAGLIKASMALHRRVLPPTLHVESPNPYWDPTTSPFVLADTARPWSGRDRRAGVSAFGFGGTNFHLVLAEYSDMGEEPAAGLDPWPSELFVFRGDDRDAARRQMTRLEGLLLKAEPWRVRDLAWTLASSGSGHVQAAIVASDLESLTEALERARSFESDGRTVFVREEPTDGRVAILFPGQGSQRPGMLAELFVAFPRLQRHLRTGERWVRTMFPGASFDPEARAAQKRAITDTRVAQPTLGMADLAAFDLLRELGLRPALMGGHSYGELVALCAAGSMDAEALLDLSHARGEAILRAAGDDPGSMAAVNASSDAVLAVIEPIDGVVLANQNAPRQSVISGTREGLEAAGAALEAAGMSVRSFPVACAFHSPVVAGASTELASKLDTISFGPPEVAVWSNTTARPYPQDAAGIRARLAEHVAKPVRFVEQIEAMYEAGARTFVEAGPGRVLSGLVGKILGDRPHTAVAIDGGGRDGLGQLQRAVAQLLVSGHPLDLNALYEGRDVETIDLDDPPSYAPSPTAWMVNGHMARPLHGELPEAAMRPVSEPVLVPQPGPTASAPVDGQDGVMLSFLANMRQMVESQHAVMMSWLGDSAPRALSRPAPARAAQLAAPVVVAAEPAVAEAVVETEAASLSETLIGIVSERTGYPVEMLGLDLDLEADLSVDSIKRIEILGALGERMGLGAEDDADRDAMIEQLASIKTLRGIIEWLDSRSEEEGDEAAGQAATPPPEPEGEAKEPAPTELSAPAEIGRFLLAVEDAPPTRPDADFAGRRIVITDDGRGVAPCLAALLKDRGADSSVVQAADRLLASTDALVHLAPLANGSATTDPVRSLFERTREAMEQGASVVLAATDHGGAFGHGDTSGGRILRGGVAGLLKSVAKEHPGVSVRVVDMDGKEDAELLASRLVSELATRDDLVEVGYLNGTRRCLGVVPAAMNGERQLPPKVTLDESSVVLITGGARGITARVAITLAHRFGCRLELVGRSPLPTEETDSELAAAEDAASLRQLLVARGEHRTPREIERTVRRTLSEREIRATLHAIRRAGSEVSYHSVDVRDGESFSALIGEIYDRCGTITGVIHGAGVLEDKLLRHKSPESFQRVFDTKVLGALTLSRSVRPDVGFVVFFSSVSGTFGNRGQADYAAANDALDKLAHSLNERLDGRVFSINWGPWGGTGMVSPELEREYARRGVGLIDTDGGVQSFVEELCYGASDVAQVILMRAEPASLR